jgi:hypothetical protein
MALSTDRIRQGIQAAVTGVATIRVSEKDGEVSVHAQRAESFNPPEPGWLDVLRVIREQLPSLGLMQIRTAEHGPDFFTIPCGRV